MKGDFSLSNIPQSAKLGQHVVIEENVNIGKNVVIGHHTTILAGTKIGDHVTIGSQCVLGIQTGGSARMRKTSKREMELVIEEGSRIGHVNSIYSGTKMGISVYYGVTVRIRVQDLIDLDTD